MTKGNFIMLANKTLYNHLESGDTYIKNIGDKITYILSYLDCKTDRMGRSNFSIEDMVLCSGLKVDTHKGKSVDQFRQVLKLRQDKGFLEDVEVDFLKVKPKSFSSFKQLSNSCDLIPKSSSIVSLLGKQIFAPPLKAKSLSL